MTPNAQGSEFMQASNRARQTTFPDTEGRQRWERKTRVIPLHWRVYWFPFWWGRDTGPVRRRNPQWELHSLLWPSTGWSRGMSAESPCRFSCLWACWGLQPAGIERERGKHYAQAKHHKSQSISGSSTDPFFKREGQTCAQILVLMVDNVAVLKAWLAHSKPGRNSCEMHKCFKTKLTLILIWELSQETQKQSIIRGSVIWQWMLTPPLTKGEHLRSVEELWVSARRTVYTHNVFYHSVVSLKLQVSFLQTPRPWFHLYVYINY